VIPEKKRLKALFAQVCSKVKVCLFVTKEVYCSWQGPKTGDTLSTSKYARGREKTRCISQSVTQKV